MSHSRLSNRKHFILLNNNGVIIATTPKDWARLNQSVFENYNFQNSKNTPTFEIIGRYLIDNLGFQRIDNHDVVIYTSIKPFQLTKVF